MRNQARMPGGIAIQKEAVMCNDVKTRTRSLMATATVFALAVLSAGCLEYEQVVTVRADGSGSIRETSFIKGPMAAMMKSMNMQEESPESAEGSLEVTTGTDDEQKARDRAAEFGEGVRLVSWEKISDDEREGGVAVYDFDDVTALRLDTSPPDMEEAGDMELEGEVEEDADEEGEAEGISFRFERQGGKRVLVAVLDLGEDEAEPAATEEAETGESVDEAGEDEMAEAMEAMTDGMAEGMAEMMKPMLQGMRMRTVVAIEGDLLESDAPIEDGSRVVLLDLDFDAIMADEEGMKRLSGLDDDASMGEFREALEGFPGVTLPPADEVRIVFK